MFITLSAEPCYLFNKYSLGCCKTRCIIDAKNTGKIMEKKKAEHSKTKVSFSDNSRTSETFSEESIIFSLKVGMFGYDHLFPLSCDFSRCTHLPCTLDGLRWGFWHPSWISDGTKVKTSGKELFGQWQFLISLQTARNCKISSSAL